ncbi:BofC C-terminal domain-containing protein [Natranaerobius trueperi]|uniref:Bypass of forespore C C-terminal domain-containing protein n=1 Tax=Natranaerobius trueperi TaxID=759412 RepID=A0A226BWQ6_9FIRM|nr:BofC C-terminal domain-containing protein [Natranaerobius trueperi]OWZ83453.1 hypothetical protein CDO51_08675 [Natranaerobius trueperi]
MKLTKNSVVTGVIVVISISAVIAQFSINGGISEEEITDETNIKYVIKYLRCGTTKKLDEDNPPVIFQNMVFEGFTESELKNFLPSGWQVDEFSAEELSLIYYGDRCPEHEEEVVSDSNGTDAGYIGIYQDKIAIYEGEPPNGELIEITRHDIKEVYRYELEEGIIFENEEEKDQILESYTS